MVKKCPYLKWLVHFARSQLQVCTAITTAEGQEVCTASETTPILPMDVPGGDNLTHSTVAKVMPHERILYKPASRYRLKVNVDLLVEGYIEDVSASHFDVVEQKISCQDDGQDDSFLEIKRRPTS